MKKAARRSQYILFRMSDFKSESLCSCQGIGCFISQVGSDPRCKVEQALFNKTKVCVLELVGKDLTTEHLYKKKKKIKSQLLFDFLIKAPFIYSN